MKPAALALVVLALVLAAITVPLVVDDGTAAVVMLIGAGVAAAMVGCFAAFRRTGRAFGVLLGATGCLWFVTLWNTPQVGSAVLFTLGLIGSGAFSVAAAHSALAYPSGHLHSRGDRIVIAVGYGVLLGLLGLAPALFFDPIANNCLACPDNLLLVGSAPALASDLRRVVSAFAGVTTALLAGMCAARLGTSSPAARRATWLVLASAFVLLLATTAMMIRSIGPGTVPLDEFTRRLSAVQAISLIVLTLAVVLEWIRLRRSRSRIARYALDIGRTAAGGDIRDALAAELRDPTLQLAYPLDDGGFVDASGTPVSTGGERRATTALVRDGRTVAVLTHRAGLSDDHRMVESVVSAARLPLDNERLSAQARAQVTELAASQLRIIEAGEAERRRLERDLHDGAQQRLVALMLTLRLARPSTRTVEDKERIDQAITTLRDVITAVRRLASGIYPAVLAQAGLAGGLAALAEDSKFPVRVLAVPGGRLPVSTETAAYLLVSALARSGAVTVAMVVEGGRLDVRVDTADLDHQPLPVAFTEIEDRIGAQGGTLTIERSADRMCAHAELPCG